MIVQFDDATSIEIESEVFIHHVSKDSNLYKDYEQLTEEQQLAYDEFAGDVKRAYRRLLSTN